MYTFILNDREVEAKEDINLLEFLREQEDLTSVKNGCSEGACGACMVLLDGKAMRACILKTSKIQDKHVITVEGLSDREKEVFAYSFGEAGAVQCGFCIPGMVISAKALIDTNNNPTSEDIKKALRGNICRCTGYIKIEQAVNMAAKIIREGTEVPETHFKGVMGENVHRVDALAKTLGTGKYVDDMKINGMLYGSALRTKYPRALVKRIDIEEAKKIPGVVAILTYKDIPGNRYLGHLVKDWPALIAEGEETRYVGDSIALVAAENKKALKEGLEAIVVDYEERTPLSSPEIALEENAPKIHEKGNILFKQVLNRGNAEEAIKNSKYVVTNKYSVPFTEHAFMEPECAIGMPYGFGVKVYTGGQNVFDDQHEIMSLLGLPEEEVRIVSKYVGGGFGGKEDMSVQHHAALLAYITKKPIKVILSRKESIMIHPKRHAMEMEFTTACDENGILTAMKAVVISDTGAYASLGGPVLQRACTHAAGPYNYHNVDIIGTAVYTNNPPGGAFRGFGVTQTAFATECNLNQLAEMVGISPWEIRYRNAIEPGQVLPNGQIADEGTALKETLEAVKQAYESSPYAGIACALKNSGVGVGVPDVGRSRLTIIDGKVHVRCGAACIGQGIGTVNAQIVCETTGITYDKIVVEDPDTHVTPNSGTTTASRQTVFAGEATKQAAIKLKKDLENKTLEELEGNDYYGEYKGVTDPIGSDKENPVSHVAYGYATQVAIIDEKGVLKKVVAAHDVGRAVNPKNVEGQIEGGVVMGLGYALTEDYPLKDSIPTAKYGTLGLFRTNQVPEIESIIIEKNTDEVAYGAKGIGEIVVIPTAPAVQGAYYKLDGKFRTKLPLSETPYRKK
ncbi:selenium-dependent xanthine dehydrogenase [Clostridium intestinale]|uniref:Xanthine dehydrogenase family protein molybdopterin-binding subunit n=1 Tax=Clostridium intestinale URNW TaxID=1294142 RepID=U2PZ49_9CLOT|nr:selenium-dependent xanthine dehydrogenase [Clostridium intestinale]ERK29034.1 xanthine dehydrogenase family protein molybdopterin-binding subunit [Clostridium intestinale URNW]